MAQAILQVRTNPTTAPLVSGHHCADDAEQHPNPHDFHYGYFAHIRPFLVDMVGRQPGFTLYSYGLNTSDLSRRQSDSR